MNYVDSTLIQKYAQKNTSPKIPMESKMVDAFVSSIFGSDKLKEKLDILSEEMKNGDTFLLFNSYWRTARLVNREPFRSIVAYAMLKKDIRLFELISQSLFTGTVTEYHGSDLYENAAEFTDEIPTPYTDTGLYTDMTEGLIQILFGNYYCDESLPDGTGSEYQTSEELKKALESFNTIITICKPARVQVLLANIPYCFISGDRLNVHTIGTENSFTFESPFGPDKQGNPNTSLDIIDNMTDTELSLCYSECSMEGLPLTVTRKVSINSDFALFSFDFRTKESENIIWKDITILSNKDSTIYVEEKEYDENAQHFEKYTPIALKLWDNGIDDEGNPNNSILTFDSSLTTGALFYTRLPKED